MGSIIVLSAQTVLMGFALLIKRSQHFEKTSFAIFIVVSLLIGLRALQVGGLTSGPALWYMGLMAFSTAFLNSRLNIAVALVIGAQVISIYLLTKFELLSQLGIPQGIANEDLHILNFVTNLIIIGFVFRLTSILRTRQKQLIYD